LLDFGTVVGLCAPKLFIGGSDEIEGSIAARVTTPGWEAGTQAFTAKISGKRKLPFMIRP